MSSMRELFGRADAPRGFVSLRTSLSAHVVGTSIGLREASRAFSKLDTGSGFESGCRRPDSLKIDIKIASKEMGGILPAWVAAGRDHRARARTLEGVLVKSKMTKEDFPLKPWHTFYDWNFFVRVDPQYRYLLNEVTRRHHSQNIFGKDIETKDIQDIIECEWDTGFLPQWAIPPIGSRVRLIGRWIHDCGHPEDGQHRLEIHPPKAIISFRSEAALLDGNQAPTRANNAVVFIGQKGGYINQRINDQDYEFDLRLPPRPHDLAQPAVHVRGIQGMREEESAVLPVRPRITPLPKNDPELLHVVVPLKDVNPEPESYGALISGGWTDPDGTEARKIRRLKVSIDRIEKRGPIQGGVGGGRILAAIDWIFEVGVNGRWHRTKLEKPKNSLGFSVVLNLHEDDQVHVTACGFARTGIHDFMGRDSGVPPRLTSEASSGEEAENAAKNVASVFADITDFTLSDSNIGLNLFSRRHPAKADRFTDVDSKDHLGPLERASVDNNYLLDYAIEEI